MIAADLRPSCEPPRLTASLLLEIILANLPSLHHPIRSSLFLRMPAMPSAPAKPSSSTTSSSPSPSTATHTLTTLLKILLIITTVFLSWQSLCYVTSSSSPVIVVISESMEPAFYRGDVLFVYNRAPVFEVGEIAVCWFEGRLLPMVHRIIQRVPNSRAGRNERYVVSGYPLARTVDIIANCLWNSDTLSSSENLSYQYLTKGDNNDRDDIPLYPPGQLYVKRQEIIGTVKGYIPYIGWVTILMTEHPWLKATVFGAVGVSALIRRKRSMK